MSEEPAIGECLPHRSLGENIVVAISDEVKIPQIYEIHRTWMAHKWT